MPTIFALRHDDFLENYLSRNEFKYFKEERLVYGKTKPNYSFNHNIKLLLIVHNTNISFNESLRHD